MSVSRAEVLGFRIHRQQLDTDTAAGDAAVLDHGVQDTGGDGALWALAIRGVDVSLGPPLLMAWTIRGAPHAYRRDEIAAIATATAPFSESDAAKRVFDAAKPLKAAGIPVLSALRTVAHHLREIASDAVAKGDASRQLTQRLDAPFLRDCRPCGTTHIFEMPFRLAALQAGLELDTSTSPPLLRRIPGLQPPLLRRLGSTADRRFHVVRNHLRFYGPATVGHVAAFLDAPTGVIRAAWPEDAVEVRVEGERRWILADDIDDIDALAAPARVEGVVRLLGAFDPYLQTRDRLLLVPDARKHRELWPALGRPGALLVDGEISGTWRAKQSRMGLTLSVVSWSAVPERSQAALRREAERLASHRQSTLAGVSMTT